MTHIQLQNKFSRKLKKYIGSLFYFYYKIPDAKGLGGLRPFDSLLLFRSVFYAIEFKVGRDKLKKHQTYYLEMVEFSGGEQLVITDKDNLDDIIKHRILKI